MFSYVLCMPESFIPEILVVLEIQKDLVRGYPKVFVLMYVAGLEGSR